MGTILKNARILIVEDEPFIALDLVQAVEQAGGDPIGPAATVEEALSLIKTDEIKAAIVDVDLPDGNIGPVLEALAPAIPVIVHTGVGLPPDLRQKFPDVPVCMKPTPAPVLAHLLASSLGDSRPG